MGRSKTAKRRARLEAAEKKLKRKAAIIEAEHDKHLDDIKAQALKLVEEEVERVKAEALGRVAVAEEEAGRAQAMAAGCASAVMEASRQLITLAAISEARRIEPKDIEAVERTVRSAYRDVVEEGSKLFEQFCDALTLREQATEAERIKVAKLEERLAHVEGLLLRWAEACRDLGQPVPSEVEVEIEEIRLDARLKRLGTMLESAGVEHSIRVKEPEENDEPTAAEEHAREGAPAQ